METTKPTHLTKTLRRQIGSSTRYEASAEVAGTIVLDENTYKHLLFGEPIEVQLVDNLTITNPETGASENLSRRLPEGYTIGLTDDFFFVDIKNKIAVFSLKDPYNGQYAGDELLFALHEIGHTHVDAQLHSEGKTRDSLRSWEDERRAWSFALQNWKNIKRESGLDLSRGKTTEEVLDVVRKALLTHEAREANLAELQREGLEPRFVHDRKGKQRVEALLDAFAKEGASEGVSNETRLGRRSRL